jgi:2-C-methyl-D-erythritol 4-phosphate cytidylyltransferase
MDDFAKAGAVIVAAGTSQRMGGEDKLFALLGGEPLLARVIEPFEVCDAIGQVVVVVREEKLAPVRRMVARYGRSKDTQVCTGGRRRQDSVLAGLELLGKWQWVVVHDGARPLVTVDLILRGLRAAQETGAAAAALPVTDTIKVAGPDMSVRETPPRDCLWAVQTPQVFRSDIIAEAYRQSGGRVTDEATLVERAGHRVKLYKGSHDNIKVTVPGDLALAEALWQRRNR